MILDTLDNASKYRSAAPGLEEILREEAALAADCANTSSRKIHGEAMFINDCHYDSHPVDGDARLEAHRRYIDVMLMLEGEEIILVKPTDRIRAVTQPYDESGDALLTKLDGDETAVRLMPGMFVVLFPQDAHCPARAVGQPAPVHKLIGKLAVDFEG